jgi:hypothetical protein
MLRAAVLFLLAAACASSDGAPGSGSPVIGETGGLCGGIGGFACENEGDYCAMQAGECKDIADAAGVCTPRPQFCTREFRPVCGCDGETYPNACSAAAEGVSVASDGVCE